MNERELERRLHGFYRAEIDDGVAAPLTLRATVAGIPATTAGPRSSWWHRRPALLVAAIVTVGAVGGALVVGSGIARLPVDPSPPIVSPLPATTADASASPDPTPEASPSAAPTTQPASEPGFRSIGDMTTSRYQHTATLLDDGRVLIVGGTSVANSVLGSSEVWDPATERFSAGASLTIPRSGHTATRLRDGRVLIIGGVIAGGRGLRGTDAIEIWDPATETFRLAGQLPLRRWVGHSSTLLTDGRVMIVGSVNCDPPSGAPGADARAACRLRQVFPDIWDPATGSVTASGALEEDHDWGSAVLLADGRVFVVGGNGLPTVGSEVWDPARRTWSRGGAPREARMGGQTATLLPDGRVLVAGGQTGALNGDAPDLPSPLASTEIWDPATRTFGPAGSMAIGRDRHTATLLPDGRIFVLGGTGPRAADFSDSATAEAEVWDPADGRFSSAGQGADARALHTATLLRDGRVLIVGGFSRADDGDITTDLASAEIWTP